MSRVNSTPSAEAIDDLSGIARQWQALRAGISSSVVAARSLIRGLALLVSVRPRTPLRVLCIMAFDTLYRMRHAEPLPFTRVRILAALLDFGACTNAAFDQKKFCPHEWSEALQQLNAAGLRSSVIEYLRKLAGIEQNRPLPGGDSRQFHEVRLYREAVVRLSLGMVATTAHLSPCLDEAVLATYHDADLNLLFRIVMQCQIIDDVRDYSLDLSAGLPSFLTASESLPLAFERTRRASLRYADNRSQPHRSEILPLRWALYLVSKCGLLAITLGRWQSIRRGDGPR